MPYLFDLLYLTLYFSGNTASYECFTATPESTFYCDMHIRQFLQVVLYLVAVINRQMMIIIRLLVTTTSDSSTLW